MIHHIEMSKLLLDLPHLFYQGASSGIGAATAVHFAKLGYKLAICGRNSTALAETAAHCLEANDKLTADDVTYIIYLSFCNNPIISISYHQGPATRW